MDAVNRIKQLVFELNQASDAYYNTDMEIMSNKEWDEKLDELKRLEERTGVILSASPTQNAGYPVASRLPKEKHKKPALSLNKTKDIEELASFLGGREGVLSWKLDGLTIVMTYKDGKLVKAVTRGNGVTGEVVTENAKAFANVPLTVQYKGELTVRGEALITYTDFNRINTSLPEEEDPYKNPRNLCSGSVRQLDPRETRRRNVQFKAFAMSVDEIGLVTRAGQFEYLSLLGFDVVDYVVVPGGRQIEEAVMQFQKKIPENDFPSDGLVLQFNDIDYGESLGQTSKYPRDSIAFKWADGVKETTLRGIEWSPSRTGLINPVAIFDPIELEGTTVSRASVHNVSIVENLSLTPGDTVTVYKANMIIPQVSENLTRKGKPVIPECCPACGRRVKIRMGVNEQTRTMWCLNKRCSAKHIGLFKHAVGRDALNIEGISEETLSKFINAGFLFRLPDLFHLKEKEAEIISMEGFGEKSFEKLVNSVEQARHTNLQKLIYAFGINNVGRTASKAICGHFNYDVVRTVNASMEELLEIQDIGAAIASSYVSWFHSQLNQEQFEALLHEVILEQPKPLQAAHAPLAGCTYVVTGSLEHYKNRNELKAEIERLGGKVAGSVSKNTNYLINNDNASTSSKNKKAKELGIPIITEDAFRSMVKGFSSQQGDGHVVPL